VFLYMTGWRVNEPLALRWDDVSLDNATAITWHEDNKGRRDERVPLHPVVIEHLRKLVDFGPAVFPWPHHERTLWVEFAKIQKAALTETGERIIDLACRENHEHTDACHIYGFHDFRCRLVLRHHTATDGVEDANGTGLTRRIGHVENV
jgi:integrase